MERRKTTRVQALRGLVVAGERKAGRGSGKGRRSPTKGRNGPISGRNVKARTIMALTQIGAETGHKRPHRGQRGKISREAPRGASRGKCLANPTGKKCLAKWAGKIALAKPGSSSDRDRGSKPKAAKPARVQNDHFAKRPRAEIWKAQGKPGRAKRREAAKRKKAKAFYSLA